MTKKYSVIIPYFNRDQTIHRCLKSIDIQKYEDVEAIVIDDCSDDPLKISKSKKIKQVVLKKNGGPVAARDAGAIIAEGEYLVFLDSDDELLPGWYERISEYIKYNIEYDFYGFRSAVDDFAQQEFTIRNSAEYWAFCADKSRAVDYLIVFRRSSYLQHNRMPRLRVSEIWYFTFLFKKSTFAKYSNIPVFKINHDAGNQISKTSRLCFKINAYERESVLYSINQYIENLRHIEKYAPVFKIAWRKRLVKESILSGSFIGFFRALFLI